MEFNNNRFLSLLIYIQLVFKNIEQSYEDISTIPNRVGVKISVNYERSTLKSLSSSVLADIHVKN